MNSTELENPEIDNACRATHILSKQLWFGILLWLAVAFSMAAILLNVIFAGVLWRFTVYQINLRILLVYVCATIVWMSTGRLIKSLYIFFALYHAARPCTYLSTTIGTCRLITWLTVAHPSNSLLTCALCVGLERCYGLFRYRAYHKRTKRSLWLSVVLLIFVNWTPTIIPQIYSSLIQEIESKTINETDDQTMPLCLNLMTYKIEQAYWMLSAYAVLQLGSGLLWILVYSLSRRLLTKISINRAQQGLAARFQVSQNFGVVRTLSPWIVLHVVCHLSILGLQRIVVDRSILDLRYTNRITLLYAVYLVQLNYSIAFPLVCLARSPFLRKRLSKTMTNWKRHFGLGHRATNIVQPDLVLRNGEYEKENGFHSNEIRSISAITLKQDRGQRKRFERIHVFSTLE